MGFFDFLKKKKELEGPDPLHDLVLSKLQPGYIVDYDMQSWEVRARHRYDFDDGWTKDEWELSSGAGIRYLERSEDDEVEWCWSRKVPLKAIEGDIRSHIIENDDPPKKIVYQGKTYYLDESGPGRFYKNGNGPAQPFVYWDFIDNDDELFVTIEQWEETEFEASHGKSVEEYQFSGILPGSNS